jgi:type IV secretory pathway VirB2 component (pilin)
MTLSPRARRRLGLGVSLGLAVAFCASPALAQTTATAGGNLSTFLQNILNLLNSGVVRLVAVLAIIATGAGWMFGHLDFRRAATVVLGIIVVFGAATIVDTITGGGAGA